MYRRLQLWLCLAGALVSTACGTEGLGRGQTTTNQPRSVLLEVCERDQCEPCEKGGRGIAVKTRITERRPVECAWDAESASCTNDGSRLVFTLDTGGQRTTVLDLREKGESHSPEAWRIEPQRIETGGTLRTEKAANLRFRRDGTTDWVYSIRVLDADNEVVACTDPRIFIHQIPPGG